MAQKLSKKELVSFKELLMASSIQVDARTPKDNSQPFRRKGSIAFSPKYRSETRIYGCPGGGKTWLARPVVWSIALEGKSDIDNVHS